MSVSLCCFSPLLLWRRITGVVVLLVMVLMPSMTRADRAVLLDGTVLEGIHIEGLTGSSEPSFLVRTLADGKATTPAQPRPLGEFRRVEFRALGDTSPLPEGRAAHLTPKVSTEAPERFHLIVESYELVGATGWFTVRVPLEPPGGTVYRLRADSVETLKLRPIAVTQSPYSVNETGRALVFQVEADPTSRPRSRRSRGSRLRRAIDTLDGGSSSQSGDAADGEATSYLEEGGRPGGEGFREPVDTRPPPADGAEAQQRELEDMFGLPPGMADRAYGNTTRRSQGGEDAGPAQQRAPWLLGPVVPDPFASNRAQIAIFTVGVLAIMGLTFFFGTFVLIYCIKSMNLPGISVPRIMACSGLLAIVPPGLFLAALMFMPFFMTLKIGVGIFAWYFTARIIVGGMLEVLEGQATSVLMHFYIVLVGIGAAIILLTR